MPDRLPFPGESWDNVGSNLHRGAIRSVCGSVPRNGCFRGYHTNTARGESKTPISRNRGEIGGKAREHIPRELIERDSKNGFYLGRRFDRRKWRDVPILETRTHNPKVVGSNPAPATKIKSLTCENGQGFFIAGELSRYITGNTVLHCTHGRTGILTRVAATGP